MAKVGAPGRGKAFLRFGLVCGGCSVALDLDHVLALWWKGLPITWENLARHAGRPLHLPAAVVSGCVCLVLGTLCLGWVAFKE